MGTIKKNEELARQGRKARQEEQRDADRLDRDREHALHDPNLRFNAVAAGVDKNTSGKKLRRAMAALDPDFVGASGRIKGDLTTLVTLMEQEEARQASDVKEVEGQLAELESILSSKEADANVATSEAQQDAQTAKATEDATKRSLDDLMATHNELAQQMMDHQRSLGDFQDDRKRYEKEMKEEGAGLRSMLKKAHDDIFELDEKKGAAEKDSKKHEKNWKSIEASLTSFNAHEKELVTVEKAMDDNVRNMIAMLKADTCLDIGCYATEYWFAPTLVWTE